jgi:deoxycytidylate deaminase
VVNGIYQQGKFSMAKAITAGIDRAYYERTDLLVVALTGRTGSGCTTTAKVLCQDFSGLTVTEGDQRSPEERKLSIAKSFLAKNWTPFKSVTVSTVIFSYLLDSSEDGISEFLKKQKIDAVTIDSIKAELITLKSAQNYSNFFDCIVKGQREKGAEAWKFYSESLQDSANRARSILGSNYAPVFQEIGDNIRYSGDALSSEVNQDELFSLMKRVKRLTKSAFKFDRDQSNKKISTRIVIDAIRNPLELLYLRDQFAAFYAIAITANDQDRTSRLESQSLTKKDIQRIDSKEASNKKSLKDYASFVSQNIQECIQKSDIFIANEGSVAEFSTNARALHAQAIRYTALMIRPGLITPTRNERCMQLAFVAKANSGCISRQVGAAVADQFGSIKSVGWNDVPKGQVPCLLRDVGDLLSGGDKITFSYFERTDAKLRKQLESDFSQREMLEKQTGLHCPYCFKDAYNAINNDDNNQVHTRSLHAEENAFLQLAKHGGSGIEGGILYTTASPCELCSKKAFQLGIKDVVYVDPYPGISMSHVLRSGDESMRPKLHLFSGAIGHAYHRLYDPILPIKDEYRARLSEDPQQSLL